jgi:hypothetical protein
MTVVAKFGGTSRRVAVGAALALTLLFAAAHAHAQTTIYNSLTLLWIASGDDGDQGQVSSYQLRYSTAAPAGTDSLSLLAWWNAVPSAQQLTLGPPLAAAGDDDSTRVTGLTQGTTYHFVLRARDEVFNTSGFSNVATGTTASCNAPTTAPNNFAASPDTGQVSVTWTNSSDPNAVSIHLYRGVGSSGPLTLYQTLSLGTTSYLDTNVSAGATYRYRASYMGAICEGPTTGTVQATLPGLPTPAPGATSASTIHAYPNPAPSGPVRVVVNVGASVASMVSLRLYDLTGRWIATPVSGSYPPGATVVTWNRLGRDGKNVGPGYYELLGTIGLTKVRERLVLLP